MTGCYFSVVQFVPDSLGYDRYAIGMIAISEDDTSVSMRFIDDWDRARAFGGSVKFLHEWIADMDEHPPVCRDDLVTMHHDYQNLLQLTEPDYASVAVTEWVRDYAHLFVRDLTKINPVTASPGAHSRVQPDDDSTSHER